MFKVLRPGLLLAPCLVFPGMCGGQMVASPQASQLVGGTPVSALSSPSQPSSAENKPPAVSPSLKAAFSPVMSAVSVLRDAASLYRHGKLEAAIEKYRLLLRVDPTSAEAHAGLARIYLKQGNVKLASETVTKGLTVSNSADLRVALGEVYFRQGKIPEAEKEWLNVVNSGNANGRAYLGLARVRNSLSLYGQGKVLIDKARVLNPIDPDIELDWNMTLSLSERIRRLQSYLASGDTSAHDRAESQHYLDYLKMLERSPEGGCRIMKPEARAEMPLVRLMADAEHLRGYGLTVHVNGRKSTLMLDTGTRGILVSRRLAEKADIARFAESRIGGVGDGGASSGYAGLAVVRIGDLEFDDCPVRVLDKHSVVEDDGLIGTDVFERFLVDIDFPGEKLRLSALPSRPDGPAGGKISTPEFDDAYISSEMQSYTKIYRFDHYLLIPTKVGNSSPQLFLLDTGGLTSQITPEAARKVTNFRLDPDREVIGINGPVKNLYSADKAILEFGNIRQEYQNLAAFDLSSASQSVGIELSGILGFETLQRLNIKIDYRDGLVDFSSTASGRNH